MKKIALFSLYLATRLWAQPVTVVEVDESLAAVDVVEIIDINEIEETAVPTESNVEVLDGTIDAVGDTVVDSSVDVSNVGTPEVVVENEIEGIDLFNFANQYFIQAEASENEAEAVNLHRRAIARFALFCDNFPESALLGEALYKGALSNLRSGNDHRAYQLFRKALKHNTSSNDIKLASAYRMAQLDYTIGNYERSGDSFLIVLDYTEDQVLVDNAKLQAALSYNIANKKAKALELFDALQSSETLSEEQIKTVLENLARLLVDKGEEQKAFDIFVTLVAKTEGEEKAQLKQQMGELALSLEKVEDAIVLFNEVIELTEDEALSTQTQLGLMNLFSSLSRFQEVLDMEKKGGPYGASAVNDATRYYYLGTAALRLDRLQEAKLFLDFCVTICKQNRTLKKLKFDASYNVILIAYRLDEKLDVSRRFFVFEEEFYFEYSKTKQMHSARFLAAETLYKSKLYDNACKLYKATNPKFLNKGYLQGFYLKYGWALSEIESYEAAVVQFSRFLRLEEISNENQLLALTKRAFAYKSIEKINQAKNDLQEIIRISPDSKHSVLAHQNLGEIYDEAEEWEKSIAIKEALLTNFEKLPTTLKANMNFEIGSAYMKLKDYENALEPLITSKLLERVIYEEAVNTKLMVAYRNLKNVEGLIPVLDEMLNHDPLRKMPESVMIWAGIQKFNENDFERAVRYLRFAVNYQSPQKTKNILWKHLGIAELEAKSYQQAIISFRNQLAQESYGYTLAEVHSNLAYAYYGAKQYAQARAQGEESIYLNPGGDLKAKTYLVLAKSNASLENWQEAARYYVLTSEFFSDNEVVKKEAYEGAAKSFKEMGDAEQAEYYQKLIN